MTGAERDFIYLVWCVWSDQERGFSYISILTYFNMGSLIFSLSIMGKWLKPQPNLLKCEH